MRTNIDIDDRLMRDVMRVTGARTKKDAVMESMQLMLKIQGQTAIRALRGKVKWEGDLEQSRLGRNAG
jgi:Arc/MetJ family transcription regulator